MLFPRLLFTALLPLPSLAWADFSGKVVRVMDGDTIAVMHNGQDERIRLFGIDAPEKGHAFGQRSKLFASEAAFGQVVTIIEHGMDRYGRTLGDVILPDGSNLNQELVRAGLARIGMVVQALAPHDATLAQLEWQARAAKLGLWADPETAAPWEWRKLNKSGMGR